MSKWPARVYVILFFGVLSFAMAPILVRWAGDVPGIAIAVWRTVIAAVVLFPAAAVRIGPEMREFTGWDVTLIFGGGFFLGMHFIAWIESLYHTTVASASVLVTTSPLLLAGLGYLFLDERLSRVTVLAIGAAVGGAALIGWADAGTVVLGRGALWGNTLAFAGALLVSFYLLIGRVVRQKVSWLAYVTPLYTTAALTALGMAMLMDIPLLGYSWRFYGLCAALALGPQVLGHGSFNYALQYVPAAIVGLLALVEPVGASVLAFFLFGEVPPIVSMFGMLVVLAAVAVVVWQRETQPADSPPVQPRNES